MTWPRWTVLLACAALVALASVARAVDAEVLVGSDKLLLVRSGGGDEVVGLDRAAVLLGADALSDLGPGDRISFVPSARRAGVQLASTIEVAPVVTTDAHLTISIGELTAMTDPAAAMSGRSAELVVDVRDRAEYVRGHIPGAVTAAPRRGALKSLLPRDRAARLVFVGDGPRDRRPVDALREALALGYANARVYFGGIREWTRMSPISIVEPVDLLRSFPPGQALVLDVRPPQEASGGAIPAAVRISAEAMAWQDYMAQPWFPVLVVAGRDAADRTPLEIADKIWRWQPNSPKRTPLRLAVLRGGVAEWVAAGGRLAKGAPTEGPPRCSPARPRVCPQEYQALLAEGPNLQRSLLLDVRPPLFSSPEWVKHIPLEQLPTRLSELPRDREIVVFCFAGRLARIAQAVLERNGFKARYVAHAPPQDR